jgi:hypothetical protein
MAGADLIARWSSPPWSDLRADIRRSGRVQDRADLRGIDLSGTQLDGVRARACFDHARLDGASFRAADLSRSSFAAATLRHACFDRAVCGLAIFDHANAAGASFVRARLASASLTGASFANADLRASDLEGVRWFQTDLEGALLHGATRARGRGRSSWRDASAAGCPSFTDALPYYSGLLRLPGRDSILAVEGCAWGAARLTAEIEALMRWDGKNWRTWLIAAAALVFAPPPEDEVAHLLDLVQAQMLGKSWISPQLACVLFLLAPDFSQRAARIFELAPGHDDKLLDAIRGLLRETDDSAWRRFARLWVERARAIASEEAKARWVRIERSTQ